MARPPSQGIGPIANDLVCLNRLMRRVTLSDDGEYGTDRSKILLHARELVRLLSAAQARAAAE